MKRIFGICLLLSIIATSCKTASYEVYPLSKAPEKKVDDGFFYTLPKTSFLVEVTVEKNEYLPGVYANYAQKLLGIKPTGTNDAQVYNIKKVEVNTIEEKDPDAIYYVATPKNADIKVKLNENNFLLSTNGLKTKSKSISKIWKTKGFDQDSEENENMIYSNNIYNKVDTIVHKIKKDSVIVEQIEIQTTKQQKTDQEKAEEAVSMINKLRETRNQLLSGYQEINYDAKTLQYMVEELKKQENEYLKLFSGSSVKSEITYTYRITPQTGDVKKDANSSFSIRYPLAYFSSVNGISSKPANASQELVLYLQGIDQNEKIHTFVEHHTKSTKSQGFYYRIPQAATASVYVDKTTLAESEVLVNQLGITHYLPTYIKQLMLSPQTGNILWMENKK